MSENKNTMGKGIKDRKFIHNIVREPAQHVCVCGPQLCPILCDPMDCSPPGSSVLGIFQARILEWVAISFKFNLHLKLRSLASPRFSKVWSTF